MAKKRKKKQESRSKKIKKIVFSSKLFYILLITGVILLIAAISFSFADVVQIKNNLKTKIVSANVLAAQDIKLTVTPTPIPTITPTPTASPEILSQNEYAGSGFCLNVPVLMYHHVQPYDLARQKGQTSLTVDSGTFDQQMGYLVSHGYSTFFADELINALRGHMQLPAKSVVVTFDDGYDDNYIYAFPILKKYGVKGTMMIPTGLLGVSSGTNIYFNWGQLNEMLGSGVVNVGNHTWSHYPVGSGSIDKDVYEISTAQNDIRQNTGRTVTVFTYPYGTNATFGRVQQTLIDNGITGAYSTIGGSYQCDSFIYSLHRTRVGNTTFPAYGIY